MFSRSSTSTVRIGMTKVSKAQGPKIFMSRLKKSFAEQGLAETKTFLLPFYDIGLFISVARPFYGKPYILRLDGIYYDLKETHGRNDDRNRPIFRSINKAKGVIYQSGFSKKLIETFLDYEKRPWCVIPNGINLREFSSKGDDHRESLGIAAKDRVLVTSSTWRAHKRLHDTIEVFLRLQRMGMNNLHLLVLGETKNEVPDHRQIHCPGFIPPGDLPSWYRTGDIFIYLSWLDNCPNTVVEAIGCGIPVVCTNQGGTKELIQRTNSGLVVDADPPYDFTMVDLYNPPKPDQAKIIAAVLQILENLDAYRNAIHSDAIDIRNIARQYTDFINTCIT